MGTYAIRNLNFFPSFPNTALPMFWFKTKTNLDYLAPASFGNQLSFFLLF